MRCSASAASIAWQTREASLRELEAQLGLTPAAPAEECPPVAPLRAPRARTPGPQGPDRARTPPSGGSGGGGGGGGVRSHRLGDPRAADPKAGLERRPSAGNTGAGAAAAAGSGGGGRMERRGSQASGMAGLGLERRGSQGQQSLAALARSVRAGLEGGGAAGLEGLGREELGKLTALLQSMEREQAGTGTGAGADRCASLGSTP